MSTTQRFNGILDRDMMEQQRVVIIGIGAVGKNLANIIAGMKPGHLTLIDPDRVDEENVGPQGFEVGDIDEYKVDVAQRRNSSRMGGEDNIHVEPYKAPGCDNAKPYLDQATCIFMCVDSMEARGEIMDYLTRGSADSHWPQEVIDTRMGAETYQIWDATTQAWTDNWFSDSESLPEACNARSTPWCATMCASHAAFYWSQILRGEEMPIHIIHDLRTNEVVPLG